ncbi:MAG: GntR family transcriptional regulator [Prevotella sp.]
MKYNESKYKLVVNHVMDGIVSGELKKGSRLPSINEYRRMFNLSRDTVFAGIKELKARGTISSAPGIGYFVDNVRFNMQQNIFLLFNEMNSFKQELYNAFVSGLDKEDKVDLQFHNYNRKVFETLLCEANGKYTTYVLMPGKFQGLKPLLSTLNGRVFLLDHYHPELRGLYAGVGQDFERDTYEALVQGREQLSRYERIYMIQSEAKEPYERFYGLQRFAQEYGFACKYLNSLGGRKIAPGDLFLLPGDSDLVDVLKQAERQAFTPGKEFGIISYNDTKLKEILAGGITTLTTDFRKMGKTMAALIRRKDIENIDNPCSLIVRKSI